MNMLAAIRGTELKTRVLNPYDEYWDWKLGVRTFGYYPGEDRSNPAHANCYVPTSYADLLKTFQRVGLSSDDVFVDIGSGMGRAVFLAAHLGVRKAIGLELIPSLHAVAEANLQHRQWPNVEFHLGDARETVFPEVTLLWMFNPFGPAVMEQMLAKLRDKHAKALRIIYLNPFHDDVLDRSGWLEKVEHIPRSKRLGSWQRFSASVWRSM